MRPFYVVIPARHGSSRLPGKPLLPIAGKPMVVRVAEQADRSGTAEIWVATDHDGIAETVRAHGFNACMTRSDHASGTDRLAEVVHQQGWDDDSLIVNVQGDEPMMPPELIRAVANHLDAHPECDIATACHPIDNEADFRNPNIVKVVRDATGHALYFSRAPIPWPRDAFAADQPMPADLAAQRHIGIYAYRARFLRRFNSLTPASLEQFEALEQLRALYHGYKIGVLAWHAAPPAGIDTEQDLQRARQLFEQDHQGGEQE